MHNFADDNNYLNLTVILKSVNKQVNYDLKNLADGLKANKIFHNLGKKQHHDDLKIKLNAKKVYEIDLVKYLGIQID